MTVRKLLAVSALALCLGTTAHAAAIADRGTLDTLLGASAVTEKFSGLDVGSGQLGFNGVLDSALNIPGLGTNRVTSGVGFSRIGTLNYSEDLYSPQNGYFGFLNPALLSGSNALQIDFFGIGTQAFGLDLLEYAGYSERVSIDIYAANDSSLITTLAYFSADSPVNPVFAGYQDLGGIGRVVLNSTVSNWGPIIDNVTFGAVSQQVPEPAALSLFGLGLMALAASRRRKC